MAASFLTFSSLLALPGRPIPAAVAKRAMTPAASPERWARWALPGWASAARRQAHFCSLWPVLGAKAVGKAGALIDCAHGIELGRPLGPADQMGAAAGGLERLMQTAGWLLAGADDDGVGGNQLWAALDLDVEAGIVDMAVGDPAQLSHVALGQGQTQRPAGAEPQPATHPTRLALQHDDVAAWRRCGRLQQSTGAQDLGIDAPFGAKMTVWRGHAGRRGAQVFGDIKADAAGADDGDAFASPLTTGEQIDVAHAFTVLDAGDVGDARADARGAHDVVEGREGGDIGAAAEAKGDAQFGDPRGNVAKRLDTLRLARNVAREIELTADATLGLKQRDLVPALGGGHRAGEPGGTGADHAHSSPLR